LRDRDESGARTIISSIRLTERDSRSSFHFPRTRPHSALSPCSRPVIPPPFRFWPRCATRKRRAREQSSVRASPFQVARSLCHCVPSLIVALCSVLFFVLFVSACSDVSMTDNSYALMAMPVARHSADGQPFGGGGRGTHPHSAAAARTRSCVLPPACPHQHIPARRSLVLLFLFVRSLAGRVVPLRSPQWTG